MRIRTAAVAGALLLAPLLTACGTRSGAPISGDATTVAAATCEGIVKGRLKSPDTAEFPGLTSEDHAKTTTLHDTKPWKYKVTGVVDSQNSSGTKVRSDYVCTISSNDNLQMWHLDDMQIAER
ncbi:hypothetical protein ACFYXS_01290 [Streptomyces sp. NPDC002574]|uniref:hypothetical protein n=1 Tax=Streptomyces sp. NPDC002574 TaxID=3364652 RepID=UPI0036771A9C